MSSSSRVGRKSEMISELVSRMLVLASMMVQRMNTRKIMKETDRSLLDAALSCVSFFLVYVFVGT